MAEYSERLPTASKSVLNLRLSTNLDAMSPSSGPAVPSACAPAPSAADGVRALYSTASMYGGLDTQRSCTTDTLGSKVSLWDLRCEVKTALDTSTGVAEVPIRADTLQRILDVMREHVHHRKTQRVLKKEAKDAIVRAEIAERETMSLHDKVAALTQQLASGDGASCGSSEDEKPRRRFAGSAAVSPDDTTLRTPSRWLLSAQTASETAGPGSAALLTDDVARGSAALLSRESMDAKSLKSDGLMGDEVEGLMSGAAAAARGGGRGGSMSALMTQPAPAAQSSGSSSPSKGSKDSPGKGKDMLRSALLALADERRKNQNLEARVEALQGRLNAQEAPAEEASEPAPPLSARGAAWGIMSMLSRSTSLRGPAEAAAARSAAQAVSAVESDDSPTHGSVADMMMALAETKVTCAEVQGKLTAARRDLARMREVNAALTKQVEALTEERDSSWEEVGKMMVQLHTLKVRLEGCGVTVSAEELERAASNTSAVSLMSARRAASAKSQHSSPGRASLGAGSVALASPAAAALASPVSGRGSPHPESSAASSTAFHDLVG